MIVDCMPSLPAAYEGVLRRFPEVRRKQIEDAFVQDSVAASAITFLLDEIARLDGSDSKAPRSAIADVVQAQFGTTYTVSQILPTRRSVKLGFSKAGVATFDPVSGTSLGLGDWKTYNVLLKLPIPKRPKPQWNVVLAKLGGAGPFLVFATSEPRHAAIGEASKYVKYKDLDVTESQVVAAYVGAREGLLYLLNDFVLFGFKKPITMVLLAEIESISFTVVTSRTFNIVVQLLDEHTYEFEKISHDFYERINQYISEHQLNDESMAEARKAKRQKMEASELEQAEKEYQNASKSDDEEDALEVDFEDKGSPKSEPDSDSADSGSADSGSEGPGSDEESGSDSKQALDIDSQQESDQQSE